MRIDPFSFKENPVSRVPKEKEDNKRDRWLTRDHENKVVKYCPKWLEEIVVFALNTGLRQDELLSLEWSRVCFVRETIIISKTKSGRPRTVPLNRIAIGLLREKAEVKIRSMKNLVFSTCNGQRSFLQI
ncbi:MAG: tyrosine-type recombinase/integrase [Planctomycetes bacterium]|nr:tyrosine-type recombinase/integrase [Planctomycetota bacterium]